MKDFDEIFSSQPPIPERKREKTPPPELPKQKRRYTIKARPEKHCEATSAIVAEITPEDLAEQLFEDNQLSNYHMVKSFLELCSMVEPENHKRLAMILEGLISK